MATTAERLGIVETKVENLNGKMDELKVDLRDVHDCLDRTRDDLTGKLDKMYNASCTQHSALSAEISNLKKEKDKVVWFVGGAIAILGWLSGHSDKILALFH
jgi:UDP-N-acetylmuramyl pentapeptide synthase